MIKWEYTIVAFTTEKDIREELNHFGDECWEAWHIEREICATSFVDPKLLSGIIRIYFKRPKE